MRTDGKSGTGFDSRPFTRTDMTQSPTNAALATSGTYLLTSSPVKQDLPLDDQEIRIEPAIPRSYSNDKLSSTEEDRNLGNLPRLPPIRPNRRRGRDVELGGIDFALTEENLSKHNSGVHPLVHTFTSPIGSFAFAPILFLPETNHFIDLTSTAKSQHRATEAQQTRVGRR